MQLIVEPETILDIEMNMSSIDNIQSNKNDDLKIVNLDIDNLNDKKCNGNEQVPEFEEDSECEVTKEIISKTNETLSDIPMNIDKNEAVLSKVDLSEIINDENDGVEIKDTHMEESQKQDLENNLNGSDSIENANMNINESKETLEEDYLEDDIISIAEEPLQQVAKSEAQNIVLEEQDNIITENTLVLEEDKLGNDSDARENLELDKKTIIDPDDILEVIEERDTNPVQYIKDAELQTPVENEDIHVNVTESLAMLPIQGKEEIQPTMHKEGEKAHESAVQNEIDILPMLTEDDDMELIDESASSPVQTEKDAELIDTTTNNEKIEVTAEVDSNNTCDNSIESQIAASKGDIEVVEVEKPTSRPEDSENDQINPIEEKMENSIQSNNIIESVIENATESKGLSTEILDSPSNKNNDEVEIIEEPKESFVRVEEKTDTLTEISESENIIEPEDMVSTEILDSPLNKNNDEVEIIEEPKESCVRIEEKTDTLTVVSESENIIEPEDTVNTEKIETSKSTSDEKVLNTNAVDAPVELKNPMDVETTVKDTTTDSLNSTIELNFDMDVDEDIEQTKSNKKDNADVNGSTPVITTPVTTIDKPIICKLSNSLNILSDDDDEELPEVNLKKVESSKVIVSNSPKDTNDKQCIDIDDDDDIMLIDEDTNKTETKSPTDIDLNKEKVVQPDVNTDSETVEKTVEETGDLFELHDKKETTPTSAATKDLALEINVKEKTPEPTIDKNAAPPPLIPDNFVKTAKKKLSDMTRDDLEEFCILKIVESIVDRSSLTEIKNKLKSMTHTLDEHRKKAMMLTKQNRDLQVVLKSVQEEQKKVMGSAPVTPLKITRSVGMQVYMEKVVPRKKGPPPNINNKNPNNTQIKNAIPLGQGPRPLKQVNQPIPVPRLIPANNPALKTPSTIPQNNQINTPSKNTNPPNGILKSPPPAMKAEKRQFNKIGSVTVDLTDDEPPTKMPSGPRTSPAPPVRLVPPQNLMGPQRQPFGANVNSPRKVYIPISGPQNQALRPGQTIMLKTVPATGLRSRCPPPQVTRVDNNPMRLSRIAPSRHPAPLPFAMKQYQPPNWKSLPPAPDLKLSKVENGIVISWKIEGVPEDSYEEIASYQLYAYQETSQPPSTTLWKKIGDVKALPLPMACTLTQFMAGFKYYFAVRAVDIRSRLGPFSLPGSILLLSKNI